MEDSEILEELATHPEAAKEYGRWYRGERGDRGRFKHFALDRVFPKMAVYFLPWQVAIVFQRSDALIKALFALNRDEAKKVTRCGLTALHLAVSSKASKEVVRTLLSVHLEYLNLSSIQRAICNQSLHDVVTVLVAPFREEAKKLTTECRFTALHLAAATNASMSVVEMLLELYPEAVKHKNSPDGPTPLHLAAAYNASEPVVKMILEAYPDATKEKDYCDWTPLHLAVKEKASAISVEMLLEAYSDATKELDFDYRTPLHCAIAYHSSETLVKMLLEANPDAARIRDWRNYTPIMHLLQHISEVEGKRDISGTTEQKNLEKTLLMLLEVDMPIKDGTPVSHGGSWMACIASETRVAETVVGRILAPRTDDEKSGCGFCEYILELSKVTDAAGRTAFEISAAGPLAIIKSHLPS